MPRVQIHLPLEEVERVKRLAAERGVSFSAIVREAVEAYSPDPAERTRRLLAAIGAFDSGREDIAQNHDEYLARGSK